MATRFRGLLRAKKTAGNRRRKPSQSRARSSVDAIVNAAAQVLQQQGYRSTTTNRIAERAGVSVGTLYQYFNNKNEIFDLLIRNEAVRYLQAIEEQMPGEDVPPRQAIRALLEAGYANRRLTLGIRTVMRNLSSTAYAASSRWIRQQLHSLVVRFLELRGELPDIEDLSLAADVMIAQCEDLTYLGRVDRTAEEQIDILTDALSRYVLLESGQAVAAKSVPGSARRRVRDG